MLEREKLINYIKDFSIKKDYVNAMWLEGADGINNVDEYSDIDFWFDVKKEYQESFLEECVNEFSKLGKLDSRVDDIREVIAQSNIHLENTSIYLTLDICVQSHEIRGLSATEFVKDDIAELPLVLFDKKNIITFCDREELNLEELKKTYMNLVYRIMQDSRVEKYIKRNMYLEAYMKYIDNVANPLVTLARIIYTPYHLDYDLCHISSHLPKETVQELEELYKVSSLEDINDRLKTGKVLLKKYKKELEEKYNF